jgi:hypothetical protein
VRVSSTKSGKVAATKSAKSTTVKSALSVGYIGTKGSKTMVYGDKSGNAASTKSSKTAKYYIKGEAKASKYGKTMTYSKESSSSSSSSSSMNYYYYNSAAPSLCTVPILEPPSSVAPSIGSTPTVDLVLIPWSLRS